MQDGTKDRKTHKSFYYYGVFGMCSDIWTIAFKRKKFFGYATDFLSSNELTLDNVNVFKRRVEFIFKPYAYNGARITFIVNVEIEEFSL